MKTIEFKINLKRRNSKLYRTYIVLKLILLRTTFLFRKVEIGEDLIKSTKDSRTIYIEG